MAINLSQFIGTTDLFGLDDNFGFTVLNELENNTRNMLLRWNSTGTENEMNKYTGVWPRKRENLFGDNLSQKYRNDIEKVDKMWSDQYSKKTR